MSREVRVARVGEERPHREIARVPIVPLGERLARTRMQSGSDHRIDDAHVGLLAAPGPCHLLDDRLLLQRSVERRGRPQQLLVTFASEVSWVTPEMIGCSMFGSSSVTQVPCSQVKLDRTCTGTL